MGVLDQCSFCWWKFFPVYLRNLLNTWHHLPFVSSHHVCAFFYFHIFFSLRTLLSGADLLMSFGRRYGLIGRNGMGKTTLLRMMASRHLKIASHITVLHVEQEVVGDDTPAIESVLSCDTRRHKLLAEEKEITSKLQSVNGWVINEIVSSCSALPVDLFNGQVLNCPVVQKHVLCERPGMKSHQNHQIHVAPSGEWNCV